MNSKPMDGKPEKHSALRWITWVALAVAAAGFAYHAYRQTVDFRVYYSTTRAMMAGSRDFYGDRSGIGWPMVYRCSPLFVLLFVPFALLPLSVASALWVILKFVVLVVLVRAIERHFARTGHSQDSPAARWIFVALVSFPFVIAELNSGNVQLLIFAMAAAGFCLLESRPKSAAALFALGTSIKAFPAFFIPYLWMRGYRRVAYSFAGLLALFLLLPSLVFGFATNLRLLRAWFAEGIGMPEASKWGIGPDYSLRGVMARYLTTMTYIPDPNFRNINFAHVSPRTLQICWLTIAIVAYVALLLLANHLRSRRRVAASTTLGALEYSLLFCAQLILAPVTEQTYFAAMLFPALILAHELGPKERREHKAIAAVGSAAALLLAVPLLVPGRANQRLLAVYAPISWGACLLAVTFLLLIRSRLSPSASE